MHPIREYFDEAKKYEAIFRNILRSINNIFEDSSLIGPNLPLNEIFQDYSKGKRYGKWTIIDFRKGPYNGGSINLTSDEALIGIENINVLSGSGRLEKYKIKEDGSVEYDSNISSWQS